MTKGLYMTDASRRTGFGIIAHNVCQGLSKQGYEMYHLGWGQTGDEIIQREGYQLIPSDNAFGSQSLIPTIQALQPEFLVVQADTRMIAWMTQVKLPIPWLFYCVIDGHVWDYKNQQLKWPSSWVEVEKRADITVAMSQWGEKIFKANGVNSTYIPHGVDTQLFRPQPEEIKTQVKIQSQLDKKDFIVGFVGKNIFRKFTDKHLQAYKIFVEDYLDKAEREKSIFLMHTNPDVQSAGEFQLPHLIKDYELEMGKDVAFSNPTLPFNFMPQIYAIFDTMLMLVGGEAFCVPFVEAMASGIPVITTNYSTGPEIIGDNKAGLLVNVPHYNGTQAPITIGSYEGVEFGMPDIYDAAKKLNYIYEHPEERKQMGFNGSVAATQKYDWNIVVPMWKKEIEKVVGSIPEEWSKALSL